MIRIFTDTFKNLISECPGDTALILILTASHFFKLTSFSAFVGAFIEAINWGTIIVTDIFIQSVRAVYSEFWQLKILKFSVTVNRIIGRIFCLPTIDNKKIALS